LYPDIKLKREVKMIKEGILAIQIKARKTI